jgi:hypothetical protein
VVRSCGQRASLVVEQQRVGPDEAGERALDEAGHEDSAEPEALGRVDRADEDAAVAELALAVALGGEQLAGPGQELVAARGRGVLRQRTQHALETLVREGGALDPAVEEAERRVEVRGPGSVLRDRREVVGQALDQRREAVVEAQVAVVVVLPLFAVLLGLREPGAPRLEAAHDAGLRRDPVPAGGTDFRLGADQVRPADPGGGQELHHAGAVEVGADEVEEQRQAACRGVHLGDALDDEGVDLGALEGRGESDVVGVGGAEEDGDLLVADALACGLLDQPGDLHGLEGFTRCHEDPDGRVQRGGFPAVLVRCLLLTAVLALFRCRYFEQPLLEACE